LVGWMDGTSKVGWLVGWLVVCKQRRGLVGWLVGWLDASEGGVDKRIPKLNTYFN
jgi:hypothetical protein